MTTVTMVYVDRDEDIAAVWTIGGSYVWLGPLEGLQVIGGEPFMGRPSDAMNVWDYTTEAPTITPETMEAAVRLHLSMEGVPAL